jgi:lysophospholipase L1-like esterase
VLGDSATFGWGSEDEDTYPANMQRLLSSSKQTRSAIEVLNAGVIGTGTGEQALYYDRWVAQFKPSLVVLSVFWNDVDDENAGGFFETRNGSVTPRPDEVLDRGLQTVRATRTIANLAPGFSWLSQHSELLTWVRQAPTDLLARMHARAVGADLRAADNSASELTAESLRRLGAEIVWLRDRAAPAPLVVAFLPSAEAFDAERPNAAVVTRKSAQVISTLQALSSKQAIPFVDVQAALAGRSDVRSLFFARDPHPNAAGNQAIAEAVARAVGALVVTRPEPVAYPPRAPR